MPVPLQPGDVLLYDHNGVFNWIIRHVSNAPVSHCEVVVSPTRTAACRNGQGVDFYDYSATNLVAVLRPKGPFDLSSAIAYQSSVRGQGYDWVGLFRAFVQNRWGRSNTKQWCSENSTGVERAGGIEPFTPDVPPDMVQPGDFLKSAAYTHEWKAEGFPL